jgi:methylisocitrate lyase
MTASAASSSPGERLWEALGDERPLQMVGAVNAYAALLAERAGFRALYLSGAGVANASLGLPDLALTTLGDVCEDVRRVTGATALPLLVDADTGWGDAFMIGRTIRELERSGAAGCHIEDQVASKRCGHRPGKRLVQTEEMLDRLKAALDARSDEHFAIVARTDAYALEGREAALERATRYAEIGADIIFAEALTSPLEFREFSTSIGKPLLANITEFGRTPLMTIEELAEAGVAIALYPLTAFRAMSRAAEKTYQVLRAQGTQRALLEAMQTREELYEVLGYHDYEKKLDVLFGKTNER